MRTDVELIKEAIDWDVILSHFNAKHIHKQGNEIRSCCFLHGGDNPNAFVVTLKNNLWYCHTNQCGGGDVFDLFAKANGLSLKTHFVTIKRMIADVLHVDLTGAAPVSEETFFNSEARKWIQKQRVNRSIAPYDLTPHGPFQELASLRHFSEETLRAYEVSYSPMEKRIVCPIRMEGSIVGVAMRRTSKDNTIKKWDNKPAGLHDALYSLDVSLEAIKQASGVILVEGPWDALSMYEAGLHNVLATLGTHITENQMRIIMKYATDLTLAYDNDNAGNSFVNSLLSRAPDVVASRKWWHRAENMFNVSVMQLPVGFDPGDMIPDGIYACPIVTPDEWLKGRT